MPVDRDAAKELFFKTSGSLATDDELDALIKLLNEFSGADCTKTRHETKKLGLSTQDEAVGPPHEIRLQRRNKCFIMSNRFENTRQTPLPQFLVDEENITKTFSWLNFAVEKRVNLTADDMTSFLNAIAKEDYADDECVALFILSHGLEEGQIMGSDEHTIKTSDIIEKLQNIKALFGRPKLVFIQACRGNKVEKIVEVDETEDKPEDEQQFTRANVRRKAQKADTFVYYCTQPGQVAYVSTVVGSFFMHKLCLVLRQYCSNSKYHFGDVVTKVNDILSTYVRTHPLSGEVMAQVSEVHSSLTSNLYFTPIGQYKDFVKTFQYKG